MVLALTSGASGVVGQSAKDGGIAITSDVHQAQMLLLLGIIALRLGDLVDAMKPKFTFMPGA